MGSILSERINFARANYIRYLSEQEDTIIVSREVSSIYMYDRDRSISNGKEKVVVIWIKTTYTRRSNRLITWFSIDREPLLVIPGVRRW